MKTVKVLVDLPEEIVSMVEASLERMAPGTTLAEHIQSYVFGLARSTVAEKAVVGINKMEQEFKNRENNR